MKQLRVGMIGHDFMGKAHSQAWLNAGRYFDLDAEPVLKVVCGRTAPRLQAFARKWGWERSETDWRKVVAADDVDIIDIATPTALHRDIAVAAAQAGKQIFCEKPFALNVEQAREMLAAAKKAGVVHYVNHNYRRCPAVGLARQLIDEGRIGQIYHWRGAYLQSWVMNPNTPLVWQLQAEQAGAGPHYDLNSHSVDLARYLVGEIKSVAAMLKTFITERPLLPAVGAADSAERSLLPSAAGAAGSGKGRVTVDDAAFMTVEFVNGALCSFEASRFAIGRKNYNMFEIYGSKGALAFNLERMNELEYFDGADPDHAHGFRTILATESCHPYVSHWWPPGHIIGYEHEFTHAVVDFLAAVTQGREIHPDFEDGLRCLQVLRAGMQSSETGSRVFVADI